MEKLTLSGRFLFIGALAFAFILSSCGAGKGVISSFSNGNSASIPVFQGMTISKSAGQSSQGKFHPNYLDSETPSSESSGSSIEPASSSNWSDISSSSISPSIKNESPIYYVSPSEEFIVNVFLDNPSGFEIQSFTLNGTKYANYMFEQGSTLEKLMLKVTAPSISGYKEYTLDAIKYIDGTEIKDVALNENRTIKTGIKFANAPTISIASATSTTTTLSFSLAYSDPNSLFENDSAKAALSCGGENVAAKSLSGHNEEITFDSLLVATDYSLKITASYDLADGNNYESMVMAEETMTTKNEFTISKIIPTKDGVDFVITQSGSTEHLDKIEVMDAETNEAIKSGDDTQVRSFSGLLSNHSYYLKLTCSYQSGGSERTTMTKADFRTLAHEMPSVNLSTASIGKDDVKFSLVLSDTDSIATIDSVGLYQNKSLISNINWQTENVFSGLLSNTSYSLKAFYHYDLNDGKGRIDDVAEAPFTTLSNAVPTLALSMSSVGKEDASFDLALSDTDSVASIDSICLYSDKKLVQSLTNLDSRSFQKLQSNTKYLIQVDYHYDLKDGHGSSASTKTIEFTTLAKAEPVINLATDTVGKNTVSFLLTSQDDDSVSEIKDISLFDGEAFVKRTQSVSERSFGDLLTNHTYSIKVTYDFDLNDGSGTHSSEKTISFTTLANATPEVAVSASSSKTDEISFSLAVSDTDGVSTIESISLYQGGSLVQTLPDTNSRVFAGLAPYTEYAIQVNYSFDMKDGLGSQQRTITAQARTAPEISITSATCSNTSSVSVGETIYLHFVLNNPSEVTISEVKIDGTWYKVNDVSTSSSVFVNIPVDSTTEGGQRTFSIDSYKIVLNGNETSFDTSSTLSASCFVNGVLKIVSFSVVDDEKKPVEYLAGANHINFLISLDNKTGYSVDGMTIASSGFGTDGKISPQTITKIDDNTYFATYSSAPYSGGFCSPTLTSVTYSNVYVSSKTIEAALSTNICLINSSEIIHWKTAADIKTGVDGAYKLYSLDNDIDLSSEEWTSPGSLYGVFHGNGHTISNMNFIGAFSTRLTYSLFNYVSGYISDLNLSGTCIASTPSDGSSGYAFCSSICSENTSKLILENVHCNVSISLSGHFTSYCVGGLTARAINATFENCSNVGNISVNVQKYDKFDYMNGFAGIASGSALSVAIKDCFFKSNFSLTGDADYCYADLITGYAHDITVENCYIYGSYNASVNCSSMSVNNSWINSYVCLLSMVYTGLVSPDGLVSAYSVTNCYYLSPNMDSFMSFIKKTSVTDILENLKTIWPSGIWDFNHLDAKGNPTQKAQTPQSF